MARGRRPVLQAVKSICMQTTSLLPCKGVACLQAAAGRGAYLQPPGKRSSLPGGAVPNDTTTPRAAWAYPPRRPSFFQRRVSVLFSARRDAGSIPAPVQPATASADEVRRAHDGQPRGGPPKRAG